MLLAVDIGNTNVVFAVFDGDSLKGQWRIATDKTRTADEYAVLLFRLFETDEILASDILDVVVSTVVPQNVFSMTQLAKKYFNCDAMFVGNDGVDINIRVAVDNPSEVGADRLVNANAAYSKYKCGLIIVDFGTATTFDVVSSDGSYIGGVISAGVNLAIDALHAAAAQLPQIDISKPAKVIGKDTVSAMQSGIYWGYVSLIEGLIKMIKKEHGEQMKIIATGGMAHLFAEECKSIEEVEPDLTIIGLKNIYKINKK